MKEYLITEGLYWQALEEVRAHAQQRNPVAPELEEWHKTLYQQLFHKVWQGNIELHESHKKQQVEWASSPMEGVRELGRKIGVSHRKDLILMFTLIGVAETTAGAIVDADILNQ